MKRSASDIEEDGKDAPMRTKSKEACVVKNSTTTLMPQDITERSCSLLG